MKAAKGDPGTQNQKITSFLLSYRTTPHTTTGYTPAELLMNRRLHTRLDLLRPDQRKKVAKQSSFQPRARNRQLSVGDPVFTRDYRKSRDPWTKGVMISKLGPMTYCVQVEDFIWKRHIDQLKDLLGTKIQPEAGERTEELPLQPGQVQPAAEPFVAKEYSYSPPQAKDYPRSPPQAKFGQTQTQDPVLCMLIGSLVPRDFYHVRSSSVYFQYPPLNDISCVYWYLVGCYSPPNITVKKGTGFS